MLLNDSRICGVSCVYLSVGVYFVLRRCVWLARELQYPLQPDVIIFYWAWLDSAVHSSSDAVWTVPFLTLSLRTRYQRLSVIHICLLQG